MRKSSWIKLILLGVALNSLLFIVLVQELTFLETINQDMSKGHIMVYSIGFPIVNLFVIGLTLFDDRNAKVKKALKEGYQEVKTLSNGNKIYLKKYGETSYFFQEYDSRGYCISSKRYTNEDFKFIPLIKELTITK